MADVLLVKTSYLKKLSGINTNTDFDLLFPTIIMVQDIYIQQILGTPLYEDLKTKIIADPDLSSYPNELALINDYISKVIVWYCKIESVIDAKHRNTNAGFVTITTDKTQPVELSDLKYTHDKWLPTAQRYAQLLTDHLILNSSTFPKYLERTLDGMQPLMKNFTIPVALKGSYVIPKHTNDMGDIC